VSHYFSVDHLFTSPGRPRDQEHAAAMGLAAGIDVELPSTDCYAEPLERALDDGLTTDQVLDAAVARVLRQKFALGLFESPYVDAATASSRIDTTDDRALALHTARKSLVLLKNEGGVLPLPADLPSIAVIGPNADSSRNLLGDYTHPAHMETLAESKRQESMLGGMSTVPEDHDVEVVATAPTVLEELRARYGDRVRYAAGCDVAGTSTDGIDEAVAIAAAADVAVLVVGDKAGLTDDSTSGEARDRSSLDLPGVQEELVRRVVATGTPVVLVLIVGRPCGSEWVHEASRAVLLGWLPGQAGAQAIAEALTGAINPGGKLPISFPRSAGHVPVYYGHKKSGGRSHWKGDYVDAQVSPLYPFGHGLSYTDFELSDLRLADSVVTVGDTARVEATVTNTGTRAGDEVVQVYIRDPEASITRPVLELKSFARVELEPGASRTVTFELPTGMLGFYDHGLDYTVEPGRIQVFVGPSVSQLTEVGEFEIVALPDAGPADKVFSGAVEVSPRPVEVR
jgi:beta-glucosidase